MAIVYLNGQFIPQENAKISIMDRGFLFGDGVYEVIPAIDGDLIGADGHLDRLNQSLHGIRLAPPLAKEQWMSICHQLLEKNDKVTGYTGIYIQVTRGPQASRNHAIPTEVTPTIVAFCVKPKSESPAYYENGCQAITLDDTRWNNCYIKATTLLPNILSYEQAREAGADEAILIREGLVQEGTSTNLFIVKNGIIKTPPLSPQILHGVTRNIAIRLAKEAGFSVEETIITPKDLQDADEVWITGSTREICPITTLNNRPVGTGKVGHVWAKVAKAYQEYKKSLHKHKD